MIDLLYISWGNLVVALIISIITVLSIVFISIFMDYCNNARAINESFSSRETTIEISEPEITDFLLYSLLKDYGKQNNMSFEDVLFKLKAIINLIRPESLMALFIKSIQMT